MGRSNAFIEACNPKERRFGLTHAGRQDNLDEAESPRKTAGQRAKREVQKQARSHAPLMLAVYVEVGFLSNRQEAASLGSGAYRQRLAAAIAEGIADYLREN